MKIITKIWGCFGMLVAGYVLTVGMIEMRSHEIGRFLDGLEHQAVPHVNRAVAATAAFKQVLNTCQDAVVFGDADGVKRAQALAGDVLAALTGMMDDADADEALAKQASAIESELNSFMVDAVPIYTLLAQNDQAPNLPRQAADLKLRSDAISRHLAEIEEAARQSLATGIDDRRRSSQRDRMLGEIVMASVLAVSILLTAVLLRSLATRLRRLAAASERLRAGAYDDPVADAKRDEVGHLADGFEAMRSAVAARDRELKEFTANLESVVAKRTSELEQRNQDLTDQITERQRAEQSLRLVESAIAQVGDGVLLAPPVPLSEMQSDYTNPAFRRLLDVTDDDAISGRALVGLFAGDAQQGRLGAAWQAALGGTEQTIELIRENSAQQQAIGEWTIVPLRDAHSAVSGVAVILRDLTERRQAEVQRQQGQKMESVGQLAAGVAHEINTPIQFIGDNLRFLQDSFNDLSRLVDVDRRLLASPAWNTEQALVEELRATTQAADIEYLTDEIPKAITQSLDGVSRVAEIVRAMKDFSHPDHGEKKATDINRAIQTTLTVARNEYKYVADLVTELAPELPHVPCVVGEFNQVILNLVVNAAHAIADVVEKTGGKGTITVRTRILQDHLEIGISDTGTGIPEHARSKIFDPFFTTKAVGKGTGQGLYIAHSVIVKKHGGTLSFVTELGKGTTFLITLPCAPV